MKNLRRASIALAAAGLALPVAVASRVAAAGLQRCAVRDITVSIGPVSPMTGEHAVVLVVAARSGRHCALDGYPAIRLSAKGRPLPFVYRHGGGPYVTTRRPMRVVVRAGHPAYVLVAKYRCDGGDLVAATTLSVRLPGGRRWVTRRPGAGVLGLAYCRRYPGDQPIDPGNLVTVSPVEASFVQTR